MPAVKKPTILLTKGFMHAYIELGKEQQSEVDKALALFSENAYHPGLHHERLSNNFESIKGDRSYRLILTKADEFENAYRFYYVDNHEDAYAWPNTHKADQKGGYLYTVADASGRCIIAPDREGLFSGLTHDDLSALGFDVAAENTVRNIESRADIDTADLTEDQKYLLNLIADPNESLRDVFGLAKAIEEDPRIQTHAFVDATDIELVPDALEDALDAPQDEWRVYLHPEQQAIVEKDYNGPAKVIGGAGTGKTVVALYRAQHLAERLVQQESDEKVLFTTFTKGLAAYAQEYLSHICTQDELDHIDVRHLDGVLSDVNKAIPEDCDAHYEHLMYNDDDEGAKIAEWRKALGKGGKKSHKAGSSEERFYLLEWERVIVPQQAFTLDAYKDASREGRGAALSDAKRETVWPVVQKYLDRMCETKKFDNLYAFTKMAAYLADHPDEVKRYRHVVVDEVQDFSVAAMRFVRQLAGAQKQNDIFLVGDSCQRIYQARHTLSTCGIDVRGRSYRLYLCYRATNQTLDFARLIVDDLPQDDLDGNDGSRVMRSRTNGPKPVFRLFETYEEECAYLVQEINALKARKVELSSICLVARTNEVMKKYAASLRKAGITSKVITQSNTQPKEGSICVAAMHTVKGFEFDYMFIAGLSDKTMPHEGNYYGAILDEQREAGFPLERNVLFVAVTRAKRRVFLTGSGTQSAMVGELERAAREQALAD